MSKVMEGAIGRASYRLCGEYDTTVCCDERLSFRLWREGDLMKFQVLSQSEAIRGGVWGVNRWSNDANWQVASFAHPSLGRNMGEVIYIRGEILKCDFDVAHLPFNATDYENIANALIQFINDEEFWAKYESTEPSESVKSEPTPPNPKYAIEQKMKVSGYPNDTFKIVGIFFDDSITYDLRGCSLTTSLKELRGIEESHLSPVNKLQWDGEKWISCV